MSPPDAPAPGVDADTPPQIAARVEQVGADKASLMADVVDFVTGRRPAVRNRVKFLLLSPIYDGFYRFFPTSPHARLAERVPADARRVLDLCTGTALMPALLAPARPGTFICGLDLSPEMLARAGEKLTRAGVANVALLRADAGLLPFPDAVFDAVTVSYGLHELPSDVRARALREARRVLRPGGRLVAADLDHAPRLGVLVDLYLRLGEPAYAREVLGDGLARQMRAAGFDVAAEPAVGGVPMQLVVGVA